MGKRCTECGVSKELEEFGRKAASRDGLRPSCKVCDRARFHAYKAANPERWKAIEARSIAKNAQARAARSRAWNLAHPERVKANTRRSMRVTGWMKFLATNARHAAARKGRACDLTEADIRDMFEKQGGRCYWLGVPLVPSLEARGLDRPSVDRLDITKGYTRDNVVLASQFANLGRSTVDVEAFRAFLTRSGLTTRPDSE